MANIKYILFDAANTLIHKPDLWTRLLSVLQTNGISISEDRLKYHHKMVSEYIDFPDQTSKEFYKTFNKELLLSLGIVPKDELLADIFSACTYLPWRAFEDTNSLKEYKLPLGVLSNFNNSLIPQLKELFGDIFSDIFVSEHLQKRKPNPEFYQHAIDTIGFSPNEILYIGDSFKLDVLPGIATGLNTLLIDRIGVFTNSEYSISNLSQISDYI